MNDEGQKCSKCHHKLTRYEFQTCTDCLYELEAEADDIQDALEEEDDERAYD